MSRPVETDTHGVRSSWIFRAAREAQLLAGRIALDLIPPSDVRAILYNDIPAASNDLERYVLEGLIARSQREIENRSSHPFISRPTKCLAARAGRILRDRYAEHWTIGLLAHELGTNRLRLTTEFKAQFAVGVHQYLVRCRVEIAERLINAGEKIEGTAYAVGFRSKTTLYAAFKRVRGTLPHQ
jgi:AraC-like DNA-binding protein